MRDRGALLLLALAVLALAGYFVFPGHTWLQSDTQIYAPMMERALHPQYFVNDIIARHPHLRFTIYDEVANLWRGLTGGSYKAILQGLQILLRFLALAAVYWICTSCRLRPAHATLVAGLYGLGTTITGPAVLTVEYEPVPRAFALPFLLLALALLADERFVPASISAVLGLLFHPPTVWPIYVVLGLAFLMPWYHYENRSPRRGLLVLLGGFGVLALLAWLQLGERVDQPLLQTIPPDWEELMKFRAAYNWVGSWVADWTVHYLFLAAVALAAAYRVRDRLSDGLTLALWGLPLLGLLSVPVSYLLLDVLKWSLIPQLQPARALLWVPVCAIINCGLAAGVSNEQRRWKESFAWLLVPFALPLLPKVLDVLIPLSSGINGGIACGLTLLLALLGATALSFSRDAQGLGRLAPAAVVLFAISCYPTLGAVRNYPQLHNQELDDLSEWARQNTPVDSVFLFADAEKELFTGIFRANALRALYVDRKGGGQVNFHYGLAKEWWSRYSATIGKPYEPLPLTHYRAFPLDYIILKTQHQLEKGQPVYRNPRFLVYAVR